MNTEQKFSYFSKSLEDTKKLGLAISNNIKSPILIEFTGDLGGGKTALIKAIAAGLGVSQTVTSPTFNIHRSYQAPSGVVLEHFDLYRLNDDEIVFNELKDAFADNRSIVCVEWAQHFTSHVAVDRLSISCQYISENERQYEITANSAATQKIKEAIAHDLSN